MSKLATSTPPGALPAGAMLGRYELLGLLSVGGMAEIYLARTAGIAGFEKLVVVKRMLPHFAMQPAFVDMFLAEARLGAMLDHPNVAAVHDIGEETGNYYYAMEYIRGADLRRIMKIAAHDHAAVPLHCAIAIGLGICAGLDHAHGLTDAQGRLLGVVHRDVTLSNVLVSYDGTVKVADFGVAKLTASDQRTRTGTLKGKVGYMSPEQCRGESLDRRSDIFAIGIILYELTTGRRLFRSQHGELEVLQRIVGQDVARPSLTHPEYPIALEEIVMRALKRDRELRYQTARELQRDLEALVLAGRLAATPFELGEYVRATVPAIAIEAPPPHPPPAPAPTPTPPSRVAPRGSGTWEADNNVAAAPPEIIIHADPPPRRWGRVALLLIGAALVGVSFAMIAIISLGGERKREPAATVAAVQPAQPPAPAPARETPLPPPAHTRAPVHAVEPARAEPPPPAPVPAHPPTPTPAPAPKPEREPPARVERDRRSDHKPERVAIHASPAHQAPADAGAPEVADPPDAAPAEPPHRTDPAPIAHDEPADEPPAPEPSPPRVTHTTTRASGPGSLDAKPSLSSISVNGPLGDGEIRRAVKRVLPAFRACYQSAAASAGKTPATHLTITFAIDGTRSAQNAHASGGTLSGLAACVQDAAARIRTRIAPDVGDAHVTVGITFDPTKP